MFTDQYTIDGRFTHRVFLPPNYLYSSVVSLGENYNESTALVITFVVNNNVDETQNEKAKAWEEEFLSFMQNFSDPDMIIAYSAEVRRVTPNDRKTEGGHIGLPCNRKSP